MSDEVVLHIGSFSSRCGNCNRPASPHDLAHNVLLGYGPENGQPGCGATYTAVASDYGDEASIRAVKRMRPDLSLLNDISS